MRQGAVLALLFLFLWTAGTQAQNRSIWRHISVAPFTVFFQPEDSLNARQIADIISTEMPFIYRELEFRPQQPVEIYIAPSYAGFVRLTRGAVPHWGEAVADPQQQVIVMKSPRWARGSSRLKPIVIHEIMHVLLAQISNHAGLPRWFNEGVAIYFSGESGYLEGRQISRAQLTRQLISLDGIDAVLTFEQNKAHLAYYEAYLAVVYLVEQYGETAITELLQTLRTSRDFRLAFQRTFGQTLFSFEKEWRYYLEKKYRWSIFLEFDTVLWALIVFLFFGIFLYMLIRNRRILARWEAEDSASPPLSE